MNPLFLHQVVVNLWQVVEIWIHRNASRLVPDTFQLDIEIIRLVTSLNNLIMRLLLKSRIT